MEKKYENKIETTNIQVKKISQKEDYESCVDIQKLVPNLSSVGVIPAYFMEIINNRGGLVLGCFDNQKLVGFNFSFPCVSKIHGDYLFVDSMGFLEEYQRKSLGFKVKKHQYFSAKEKGIRYIIWTYDPLMGVNANINIRKLGGTVSKYIPDKYDTSKTNNFFKQPSIKQLIKESIKKEFYQDVNIPGDRFEPIFNLNPSKNQQS
jgi:predicted GNAT superfamily acetyltransferase